MARIPMSVCAYAAGLFDGEGCVKAYVGHSKNQGIPNAVSTKLVIVMTDAQPLEMLHRYFGGSLWFYEAAREGWNDHWTFSVAGRDAEKFARAILPFAIGKRRQLELFLELRSLVGIRGKNGLSVKEISRRAKLVSAIREEKSHR